MIYFCEKELRDVFGKFQTRLFIRTGCLIKTLEYFFNNKGIKIFWFSTVSTARDFTLVWFFQLNDGRTRQVQNITLCSGWDSQHDSGILTRI